MLAHAITRHAAEIFKEALGMSEDALTRHEMRDAPKMLSAYSRLGNGSWGAAHDGIDPEMGKAYAGAPQCASHVVFFEYY